MVWKATINLITQEENIVIINVTYSNGSLSKSEDEKFGENSTLQQIATKIRNKLNNMIIAEDLRNALNTANFVGRSYTIEDLNNFLGN